MDGFEVEFMDISKDFGVIEGGGEKSFGRVVLEGKVVN